MPSMTWKKLKSTTVKSSRSSMSIWHIFISITSKILIFLKLKSWKHRQEPTRKDWMKKCKNMMNWRESIQDKNKNYNHKLKIYRFHWKNSLIEKITKFSLYSRKVRGKSSTYKRKDKIQFKKSRIYVIVRWREFKESFKRKRKIYQGFNLKIKMLKNRMKSFSKSSKMTEQKWKEESWRWCKTTKERDSRWSNTWRKWWKFKNKMEKIKGTFKSKCLWRKSKIYSTSSS